MVGERLKRNFDEKPVIRRVADKFSNPGHRIRDKPGSAIRRSVPRFDERNVGGGIGAGAVGAGIAVILGDTAGVPFGGSADIQSVESVSDGTMYTVNVNSPTQNMAKVRAFIDAGTGFTSLLTDKLDVQDVEVIGTRTLRDTYQVDLKIVD